MEYEPEREGGPAASETAEPYHIPVLKEEVVEELVTDTGGIYVDGTLGGGGHTEAILERLSPAGRVIGIDRDPEALERCRERFDGHEGRLTLIKGNYSEVDSLLKGLGIKEVTGVLLDLGVSSRQLDEGERGFSFMRSGPLDMRMGDEGVTAARLVNTLPEMELKKLFYEYGEESRAPRAARAIAAAREKKPFETTGELAATIEKALGRRGGKHPATKVFQALRIAVNRELEGLKKFLEVFTDILEEGGRVAIITYHSLEDRMVKRALRDMEPHCICPPAAPVCTCGEPGVMRVLTRKAVKPARREIEANPRARSAKLRIAEIFAKEAGGTNEQRTH
ncbi:MAG: 16S rRNA (cytosine(1402)-N(4))-methyltransferase [Deltaproteobacteria bacterium]|nr:MAG: 16S rRNA (cytosine(1402)-N(4))-methyltransferase [Deltaproteobacteria bacterium]